MCFTHRSGVRAPRSAVVERPVVMNARFRIRLLLPLLLLAIAAASAQAAPVSDTGWIAPYAGTPRYLGAAPTQVAAARQLHAPLGLKRADRLAARLGFRKSKAMSPAQAALFLSGEGSGGGTALARNSVQLINACAQYLTNSSDSPQTRVINGVPTRIVLGSYGLVVNPDGMLESPSNTTAPCRQVNWVLAPIAVCSAPDLDPPSDVICGYMGKWMRANGAVDTLRELYRSPYPREGAMGAKSQDLSGVAQLVPNTKSSGSSMVGMSMIPSIWFANFLLLYALNPHMAAKLPAYWQPIPANVEQAIIASPTGQVSYAEYQSSLK